MELIINTKFEKDIKELLLNYKKDHKLENWKSEDIEEFGINEFIGGKVEAFEEVLELIEKYKLNKS